MTEHVDIGREAVEFEAAFLKDGQAKLLRALRDALDKAEGVALAEERMRKNACMAVRIAEERIEQQDATIARQQRAIELWKGAVKSTPELTKAQFAYINAYTGEAP